MKFRVVVAGWILGLGALASAGCSGDDPLIKWSCECGDACEATESDARSVTGETCSNSTFSRGRCETTGDVCACPNGDSKCEIKILR